MQQITNVLSFNLFFVFMDNFSPKLKSVAKLKQALEVVWDNFHQQGC